MAFRKNISAGMANEFSFFVIAQYRLAKIIFAAKSFF
jgi:hypothetical protein